MDNYFIKALALNGQCKTDVCLSSIYYGATFSCKVTTSDNVDKAGSGH